MHLQNIRPEPKFEIIHSRKFLVYKSLISTSFMAPLPEINNSPLVAVSLACVHVLVGSTSFMALLPGIEGI